MKTHLIQQKTTKKISIGDTIMFDWYDRYSYGYGVTRKVIDETKYSYIVRFRSTKWIVRKEDVLKAWNDMFEELNIIKTT